jgi:hypothetical protein
MTKRRSTLSSAERQEYRDRLLRLERMGVAIGPVGKTLYEPARLTFEFDHRFARVYDLPLGEVAVMAPAKMTVFTSGTLITDAVMIAPWNDLSLELSDPKECPYYDDLTRKLPELPANFFNHWLTRGVPLRLRQEDGVIFAKGWGSIPPECHDETLVSVKLLLTAQRHNEMSFDFEARVDRSVQRKYQPRQGRRPERLGLKELLSREPSSDPTRTRPYNIVLESWKRLQESLKTHPRRSEVTTASVPPVNSRNDVKNMGNGSAGGAVQPEVTRGDESHRIELKED